MIVLQAFVVAAVALAAKYDSDHDPEDRELVEPSTLLWIAEALTAIGVDPYAEHAPQASPV